MFEDDLKERLWKNILKKINQAGLIFQTSFGIKLL
jgi:hypothetical protein